ncbi:UNVERIFIED_CONTAM: hypothetical protein FKN15_001368 [Acipenser sinensis]
MGVQQGQPVPPLLLGNLVLGQHTWLGDEVMDHSQALLHRQYPQVGGLYAVTCLTQLTSFSSPAQGFVQILNVSGNHWVTVTNIGCEESTLNVFDSLGINNNHDFRSQVLSLLQYSGKTVRIVWPHVQQQGCSDCGLFTIANSLTLCMGGDSGTTNMLCSVDDDLLTYADRFTCTEEEPLSAANAAFRQICESVLEHANYRGRSTVEEATASYMLLSTRIVLAVENLNRPAPLTFS